MLLSDWRDPARGTYHFVKLYFFLLLTLALCLMFTAACGGSGNIQSSGGNGAHHKPFTIGVSNGFVDSEWRTQMLQDMQTVNAEYKREGLTKDLVIESADVDVQGQIQQIRNLINRGVDAIIIDPNSPTALNPVIEQAIQAGIVVVSVDQEVSAKGAVNVTIDQREWARISMRWLAQKLNGKGNIVVINGIAGTPADTARYNGVKDVLSQYPGIKVLNVVNANWDEATGQQKMAALLASQPNIDGVWSQDGMAQGALQAVIAANPPKWPIMVGEARAGYLQLWAQVKRTHPTFSSIGVINPPGVGASGLRVAIDLLLGKHIRPGVLAGQAGNTIYVPIPGEVTDANFASEYARVKDLPQAYTLDGYISQQQADSYFS
uniref:Sugar ABC transporter substrate-binding protein n=1 Tax=Thermogemmatispora argillosa TaxID=2045280 RepID=A0A455SYJ8_9CHLR|nr:sugar ABC transporter substrate-binding protein [Thermogemmatispora argillosa]